MRKTKKYFSWSKGMSTVFYSLLSRRFIIAGKKEEREFLLEKYGGEVYHISRSGNFGSGHLTPEAGQDDLIYVGTYSCFDSQNLGEPVFSADGKRIYVLVPLLDHEDIDNSVPIVVTDGEKVLFANNDMAINLLQNSFCGWNDFDWRELSRVCYDHDGQECEIKFHFANPLKKHGVDAFSFVDLPSKVVFRWYAEQDPSRRLCDHGGLFGYKLSIKKLVERKGYFHAHQRYDLNNRYDILDFYWNDDPMKIVGEIYAGWIGTGTGIFWRRRRHTAQVDFFWVMPRKDHPVYCNFDFLPEYMQAGKCCDETDAANPWWLPQWQEWVDDLPSLAGVLRDNIEHRFKKIVLQNRPVKKIVNFCRQNKTMEINLNQMLEITPPPEECVDYERFQEVYNLKEGLKRKNNLGTVLRKRNSALKEFSNWDLFREVEFLALIEPLLKLNE